MLRYTCLGVEEHVEIPGPPVDCSLMSAFRCTSIYIIEVAGSPDPDTW